MRTACELGALRTAKLLLDQHSAHETWRMLAARSPDEHLTGEASKRAMTQEVLSALHKLTGGLKDDVSH